MQKQSRDVRLQAQGSVFPGNDDFSSCMIQLALHTNPWYLAGTLRVQWLLEPPSHT